jgi:hypothetical protein
MCMQIYTYHDSSTSKVPKSRMCIFVPSGQLSAGTAAEANRAAALTEAAMLEELIISSKQVTSGVSNFESNNKATK